eukprot:gene18346-24811_t
MAEARATEAEQTAIQVQAQLASLKLIHNQSAVSLALPDPSSKQLHFKVVELELEVESAQHSSSRCKSRLSAAQAECAALEDELQREKSATMRLRQQLSQYQQQMRMNAGDAASELCLAMDDRMGASAFAGLC